MGVITRITHRKPSSVGAMLPVRSASSILRILLCGCLWEEGERERESVGTMGRLFCRLVYGAYMHHHTTPHHITPHTTHTSLQPPRRAPHITPHPTPHTPHTPPHTTPHHITHHTPTFPAAPPRAPPPPAARGGGRPSTPPPAPAPRRRTPCIYLIKEWVGVCMYIYINKKIYYI